LYGKSNKIAQAKACYLLPGDAPMLPNGLNMLIPLFVVARIGTSCVLWRWNVYLSIRLRI
jgi:hypothetical protein